METNLNVMTTKRILPLFAIVFLLFSCSKDQRVVNKLSGNWNVESWKISALGQSENLSTEGASYNFSFCNLKADEWCSGQFTVSNETTSFQYKVIDGGKKFVSRDNGSEEETVFDIISISKSRAEVKTQIQFFTHEIVLTK